ncbi:peptidoglycan-binding protein [Duganella sp. BJB488]|uniref:AAA family ATPase n=1 Tax=unclassified Duganella TaxID=2636909 RepID=UPI000E34A514|nr:MULTISPECIES: AAA family ATPase [unclassified Duganella]RFP09793.1 peptidoglycan-binding protein [Duganella sp. BJB489]RFP13347.1 peptidoglycan-binding protein [Duganella sp. BJB488]RFP29358.1 peptidoglycan-binding protein [Duganella sp. BJB480]
MYTHFFNLKQSPFSIAPDPRYLFMSERHREALAHLLYGVGSGGGFVLLTGEIGAGKTTVCRCFMEQIPDNCKLAYIFNPKLSVEELLLSICDEFGIALAPQGRISVKGYVDAINAYLLDSHAQGRNNVLIIDEAQNLSAEVLEQLRLLTNLETSERKLLQIILIGQPELRAMVARPELEQLAQRVIARYHLGSLSEAETGAYIEHRLAVAGAAAIAPFPRRLMGLVHSLAKGVPRRINLLCDRALLGAYVENQPQVTRNILRKAAAEVFARPDGVAGGEGGRTGAARWPWVAAGVLGGVILSVAGWQLAARDAKPALPGAQAASAPVAAPRATLAVAAPGAVSRAAPAGSATVPAAKVALAGSASALGGEGAQGGSAAALRQLAAIWGLALPDGEPCPTAARLNLRCLQVKGGMAELRLLDRPAMLTLHDDPTAPNYVLLTAIDDGGATIVAPGGKPQRIGLDALTARFDGEFTTFWRAPRSWRDEVSGGDHGPDVDWLARRLAQIYGLKKPLDDQPLSAGLRARLVDFQTEQHLKADGVAGPKTFIRLYQLGGVQEPRLLAAGAGAGK